MSDKNSKALLVILDGFGIAEVPSVSAIERAETPFIDSLFNTCPHSKLRASGPDVGLPEDQFGNSEVGHLNIGAGRIIWQELSRINKSINDRSFFSNEALAGAFTRASKRGRIHLMGLFSDGGVHSHIEHLYALLEMAEKSGIKDTFVHAFTDGRDTSPQSGIEYCREFEKRAKEIGTGKLASIIGRYFAMDRDNRWERTEKAFRLLTDGTGTKVEKPEDAFVASYENDVTDEFLEPYLVDTGKDSRIRKGDVVIFFNIRGDRVRQILKALLQFDEVPFDTPDLQPDICSFTSYDESFSNDIDVAWPPVTLKNTLGEYASTLGLTQLRIAETEKYAHVTYFLNGGEETPWKGEDRVMIPSPKVATYDLQPEMSAPEVTKVLCEKLDEHQYNLVVLNYANPDMVGHTGIMDAAVTAVETIDAQLQKTVTTALRNGYKVLVIADHGNVDQMIKPDGSPHTAHTTALVPAILIGVESAAMRDGILADVAPTLLKMMGVNKPVEMTGTALF